MNHRHHADTPAIDVLDDFSKPKSQPAPPTAPADSTGSGAAPAEFDEDAFLKQLEKDMANMMGGAGAAPGVAAGAGPANASADGADFQNFQHSIDEGADAFAKKLEESGIPPGDFLKQLLADVMAEEGGSGAGANAAAELSGANATPAPAASSTSGNNSEQPAESFNEAIQRTMERMKDSGNRATEAASTDDGLSDDMLAQLLKAVEAGASGGGEDGDLTKMFMGMMEQLSNKEMLYEPMKELDGKFGPWIEKNKADNKVSAEDMERYEKQARIVNQIVTKFEENGYSDEDPKCREYVWERMQEVRLNLVHSVVEVMVDQKMLIIFPRCKPLGAHLRNSSLIPSWVKWAAQLQVQCLRECPIARNNKMKHDNRLVATDRLALYCTYTQLRRYPIHSIHHLCSRASSLACTKIPL